MGFKGSGLYPTGRKNLELCRSTFDWGGTQIYSSLNGFTKKKIVSYFFFLNSFFFF
jgi:hypothetical protein